MDTLIRNGVVCASREVLIELEKQDDDLYHWCKAREDDLFIDLVEELQDAVTALLAKYPKLVATGRNKADPFEPLAKFIRIAGHFRPQQGNMES